MEKGKLLIFSAPSGSGKTTLLNHLLSEVPGIAFSVSATTRPPRGEEQNGVEYYFMSLEEFQQRVANDEFLEWEEVYPGRCYGTLKAVIEKMRNEGYHVAFDVDVVGGTNIKKFFGDEALSVFIQAPSIEVLRERLINRGTDSMEEIEKRVSKAAWETDFAQGKFDTTIINDDLDTAKREIVETVRNFFETTPAAIEENPTV
ncbi:MAG: guanylate kinase [Bacteroidales bacterium]|nr:guanylate kinase [Bacteroidales bacterium]